MDRGRLEAFSDGVFAVAITLLALNLAVKGPGLGNGTLAHQLAEQWQAYVAYLISFFTIGIIWVNHHALLSNLVQVTRTLLFLNLVLLLFVVLVPVATGTVADYLKYRDFDAELADTDLDALPAVLHRWATLGNDGFLDLLLSAPLEGLEFGGRSYDDTAGGE